MVKTLDRQVAALNQVEDVARHLRVPFGPELSVLGGRIAHEINASPELSLIAALVQLCDLPVVFIALSPVGHPRPGEGVLPPISGVHSADVSVGDTALLVQSGTPAHRQWSEAPAFTLVMRLFGNVRAQWLCPEVLW